MHVHISPDRQVRRPKCTASSISAVTLILLTWNHSVPHPASPLRFCVLILKQGRLCSDSNDVLAKVISVCQGTTKFHSLNRPSNSLNPNASSAKVHYGFSSFYCHQQLSVNSNFILHSCTFLYIMDAIFIPRHSVMLKQARVNSTCLKRESGSRKAKCSKVL